jgi:phosphoribosylformimino-5-aminoimidazole carboxamide ribotide isomerase
MFSRFGGDHLTLALDVFVDPTGDARIAVRGWQKKSRLGPQELIDSFLPLGLRRVLCTDISKDGMLAGPNVELYWKLSQVFPQVELQASGGVSSLEDLLALKKASVHSAIVGKAIYEQGFDLAEAIRRC